VSAATVCGTGTMSVEQLLPPSSPGMFLRHRNRGFTAYITATAQTLSTVRRLTRSVPVAYGAAADTAASAQLVVSELIGNAVNAFGDFVPLVIEVYVVLGRGIAVTVLDPVPELLPQRGDAALDSESGRGLALLDAFAPGWQIECTGLGKQLQCLVQQ